MTIRRHPRAAALLCVAVLALAAPTAARQDAADAPAMSEGARIMDAARSRLIAGDTNGAISRAALARSLDPDVEIPRLILERALDGAGAPATGAPNDQRLADLRDTVADLERQMREQSRTLEGVARDLRDGEQAEPVVQRLEREIDDLTRRLDRTERDLQRLQRQVDRLR